MKCSKPKCYFETTDPEAISEHLISHNEYENTKCPKPKCSFEAKNKRGLSCHLSQHKDCTYCEQTFFGHNGLRNLQRHLKKHEKDVIEKLVIICQICSKDFKYQSHLKRHRRFCTAEKFEKKVCEEICSICNKELKNKKTLRLHMLNYHQDSSKILPVEKVDHNYAIGMKNKSSNISENVHEGLNVEFASKEKQKNYSSESLRILQQSIEKSSNLPEMCNKKICDISENDPLDMESFEVKNETSEDHSSENIKLEK